MDVKETLNVAGLLTNVYAQPDLRDKRSSEPIVVLFFLHGRGFSAETVDPTARAAFAWVAEKQASSKQSPRDFIVVTFVRGFYAQPETILFELMSGRLRTGRTSGTTERGR
jgi:hypothetical protein